MSDRSGVSCDRNRNARLAGQLRYLLSRMSAGGFHTTQGAPGAQSCGRFIAAFLQPGAYHLVSGAYLRPCSRGAAERPGGHETSVWLLAAITGTKRKR